MPNIEPGETVFRLMDPKQAIQFSMDAINQIDDIAVQPTLVDDSFSLLEEFINTRAQNDLRVDPTRREEVEGIVRSALRGNDHVQPLFRMMVRYTVGAVQVEEALRNLDLDAEAMK